MLASDKLLATYFPLYQNGGGHSAACLALCEHMRGEGLDVEMYCPAAGRGGRRPFTRAAVPEWLWGAAYRVQPSLPDRVLRRRFRRRLERADGAHIWAASPESIYDDVNAIGLPLFVERINCLRTTAKPILDEAYRRAGMSPAHGITEAAQEEELRKLSKADWIFSPSPMVLQSLTDAGIPASKVLPTSYGWSPDRMRAIRRQRHAEAPPEFLYVGLICVRKGAHLLLDAWAAAAIRGTLSLYGGMKPEIEQVAGPLLSRPGVRTPGHVESIAQAFADSDVFVFPTLEEGGPLVTYEAASHGLAILTSPMGAGAIVRDGIEGIVRDPYDREGWIDQIRRLGADPDLRARLGAAARARSLEFTWRKVGERRRQQVLHALGSPE